MKSKLKQTFKDLYISLALHNKYLALRKCLALYITKSIVIPLFAYFQFINYKIQTNYDQLIPERLEDPPQLIIETHRNIEQ